MLSDRSFDFVRNNANRQQGQQSCQFVLPEQQQQQPQRQQRTERNQNKGAGLSENALLQGNWQGRIKDEGQRAQVFETPCESQGSFIANL